jgi:aminopeptidase
MEANMTDPRLNKLADIIINYSLNMQKGEKILIETTDCGDEMAKALVNKAYEAGAIPLVHTFYMSVRRAIIMGLDEKSVEEWTKYDEDKMKGMDAYVSVRGNYNNLELIDVPHDKMHLYESVYYKRVHFGVRIPDKKWVVLRYPNPSMAQLADMSTEEFEDFYFNVCTLDYAKMDRAMDALKARMERADQVHIKGVNTDLKFSIKGIPVIKCSGHMNLPDGEIYTAPVKNSVNGRITYNTPSIESGFRYENISFEFKDGKIVDAKANDTERVNRMLDIDEGARYVGEFAFGVNPYIKKPMCDTLFDEKIAGSIHFTPGTAYKDAYNGNNSAQHWDLVYIQRPEYGGGEIYFDGELIRKDGVFVPDDLKCLNEENLK